MASPWEAEQGEEKWSDREAWRGDRYPVAGGAWAEEEDPEPETSAGGDRASGLWRAELPAEDWPEELAGPEYWMYKRMGPPDPG